MRLIFAFLALAILSANPTAAQDETPAALERTSVTFVIDSLECAGIYEVLAAEISITIAPGDTKEGLAQWLYGSKAKIGQAYLPSRSSDPNTLFAGEVIRIRLYPWRVEGVLTPYAVLCLDTRNRDFISRCIGSRPDSNYLGWRSCKQTLSQ